MRTNYSANFKIYLLSIVSKVVLVGRLALEFMLIKL